MTQPKTILIRGVNWLGDAVMTTPALLRLREKFPSARIHLLTPAKLADLWLGHPALDSAISIPPKSNPFQVARLVRHLRADLALIFPNSFRSALEPWLAGIPKRLGAATPGRRLLLTSAISSSQQQMRKRTRAEIQRLLAASAPPTLYPATSHHLLHYLNLAAAAGANPAPLPPSIHLSTAELESFQLRWQISPGTRWLGLNPGAEYGPAKRWPPANFIELAQQLHRAQPAHFLIFGARADLPLATSIAEALRARTSATVHNLAGQTTLRELAAGLKLCSLLITNDTGPMHLAAALGTPVAAIFGSTSPELTGPGLPGSPGHLIIRSAVPCTPCFLRECPIDHRCLLQITPDHAAGLIRNHFSP